MVIISLPRLRSVCAPCLLCVLLILVRRLRLVLLLLLLLIHLLLLMVLLLLLSAVPLLDEHRQSHERHDMKKSVSRTETGER